MVQNPLLEGTWRSKAGTISPWECRVCSVVDLAPAHAGAFEVTAPGTSRETANRGDGVSYVSFPFAKTGCRHSHDLIACRNHFPGCCVGGGRVQGSHFATVTVSVPTNFVKRCVPPYMELCPAQRTCSHVPMIPSVLRVATAQHRWPKTCCPLPARETKRPRG